jgi:hypothetical protein
MRARVVAVPRSLSSAIFADLEKRGFAISFRTRARTALLDSFSVFLSATRRSCH